VCSSDLWYADIVWFLYRDEYYNADTNRLKIADLIINKNRTGPIGMLSLFFDAKILKFEGLEK
jgi:replicative DNA helicase